MFSMDIFSREILQTMKHFFFLIICAAGMWGCASTSSVATHALSPIEQLRQNIDRLLADSLFLPSHVSLKIVSLQTGESFYERDKSILMNPASNVKLFTSSAAIVMLGKNYQFKTSVLIDSCTPGGVVLGNCYLKGYGDPLLSTSDLDSLACMLEQKGITHITGGVAADNSYFDDRQWGLGWTWDDEPDPDAAFINALTVNKGCVSVSVSSDSAHVSLSAVPQTSFIRCINTASAAPFADAKPFQLHRTMQDRPNIIYAEGYLEPFSFIKEKFSVRRPDLYAAQLFSEALRHHHIAVHEDISSAPVRLTSREIASCAHSLDTVVTEMNKESDNLAAENLLKILGAVRYGAPGTSKTGCYAVNNFLSTLGIDTTKYHFVDGSGVSRYNLVSADVVVQLLAGMYRWNSFYSLFFSSLPVAGRDGTLCSRMCSSSATAKVNAKTGTLSGVSTLSGYTRTLDGEPLAFSMMMQNFLSPANKYRAVQDSICIVLTSFSRKTNE